MELRKLDEPLLEGAVSALTANQTCQDMACSKFLSFHEIVKGRKSDVRITDDGLADVVDTIMVVTGKDCNHANACFRGIKPSLFDNQKVVMRNQRRYVTLRDAITLIMVLPGSIAKEIRSQFAAIIERYIEIEHDATSGANTIHLKTDPAEDPDSRRKRLKREDLELIRIEEEINEKRASTKRLQIQNVQSFLDLMTDIRPDWKQTDARFRLQTEDIIKNIMVTPVGLALTDGKRDSASLSISQLVLELGGKPLKHADACRAGALAAKRYREVHDADPPKHAQWVDGAERSVNSYTEADRALLTAVLTDLDLVQAGRI